MYKTPWFMAAVILFSGICWWLAFSLSGGFGWLLFIAPAPVLLISYHASPGKSFLVAFLAYGIGRTSWLSYLLSVAPAFLAIIYTIFLPLVFAIIVLISRAVMRRYPGWIGIFAFPALVTGFEFLSFIFSHDGTFGSLAYSVADLVPVIQIASITGIAGITFILCLIPSCIAAWIYLEKSRYRIGAVSLSIMSILLFYGFCRMTTYQSKEKMRIGMAVIDEKAHWQKDQGGQTGNYLVARQYDGAIHALATAGARLVLLPENITDAGDSSVTASFQKSAVENRVFVIVGYRIRQNGKLQNRAIVFSPQGQILADYQKRNLFEGEMAEGYSPGDGEPRSFAIDNVSSAVAICKDMDFQAYIHKANSTHPKLFFAPAWDFDRDGWLHGRMALLRSVENGYSLARNARRGTLTINDDRGHVVKEVSSADDKATSLLGEIPIGSANTIYARTGDWFGFLNLFLVLVFIFLSLYRKK